MPARGGGGRGGRGGRGSKPVRGGGKKFSRNLKPLDGNGDELPGMWDGPREEEEEDDSSEEEESGSEEESSEEEEAAAPPATRGGSINFPPPPTSASEPEAPQLTREQIKAAKKATKEAKIAKLKSQQQQPGGLSDNSYSDDDEEKPEEIVKPKQPVAAAKGFATNNLNSAGASTPTEQPLTRREREAIEAAAAKERYRKLHEAGKTDEAKNDMARLALIRKEREEKAKQRAAELEEKKRIADVKAAASGKRR